MERNYTEAVRDGFFDLIEKDTVEIWENLDRSVAMIKSGKWKEHYSEVVAKYRFSSRFAIMRVLFEKATGLSPSKTDEQALSKGFSVAGIGNFPNITIKHAKEMTDAEVDLYRKLLLRRVEENNPDFIQEAIGLVSGILELPAAGTKCKLTRDELIRLGHMVDFSLEDMQFILLRVLGDNEAGFKYSASTDIIDIYGFLTRSTLAQVDELKVWYDQNAAKIKKVEYADKPVQFTLDIANSFEHIFSQWSPENQVTEFQSWLLKNAPYLDLKSKTARKVYVNLAMYAYASWNKQRITRIFNTNELITDNFYDDMLQLSKFEDYHAFAKQLFFKAAKPDSEKCKTMAKILVYENAALVRDFDICGFDKYKDDSKQLEKLYHTPYLRQDEITSRGEENGNIRQRIESILMDRISPSKNDLLYLLWIIANYRWIGAIASVDDKVLFMDEFLAAAACILEGAFLPEFYPPNILEETMLLSIVLGNEENSPAMVYETICSIFTDKGKTKKKAGATTTKTLEQKREIAEYFYSHLKEYPTKGACEEACAKHFGIAQSSVQNYCRAFRNGKL